MAKTKLVGATSSPFERGYTGKDFSMKKTIYIITLLLTFSKCKLAKEPTLMPFHSINESKKNNAFITELMPQERYLEIEGVKHYIENAWIEHPHHERNFGNEVQPDGYCFVMTFKFDAQSDIDLKPYFEDLGHGSDRVWFFLLSADKDKDTIKLNYRSTLSDRHKEKIFLLFPSNVSHLGH